MSISKKAPKVSIIVPVYNVEPWLPRCLDSLVGQTLQNIEIILINDGSTDKSGKIADEYAAKDKRIKVIHQKNGGVSVARNAGLKIAIGEYIGFVDSDDWVDEDFFSGLYSIAKQYGSDIIKGNAVIKDLNNNISFIGPSQKDILKNRAYFSWTWWTAIYRREMLEKNKIDFPKGIITNQDVVFLTKAVIFANKIDFCNESLYHYEMREGSLDSSVISDENIQSRLDGNILIMDFIAKKKISPEIYSVVFSQWMEWWLENTMPRVQTEKSRKLVVSGAFNLYKKCKYPQDYKLLTKDTERLKILDSGDSDALYSYLRNSSKPSTSESNEDTKSSNVKKHGPARFIKHIRRMKF